VSEASCQCVNVLGCVTEAFVSNYFQFNFDVGHLWFKFPASLRHFIGSVALCLRTLLAIHLSPLPFTVFPFHASHVSGGLRLLPDAAGPRSWLKLSAKLIAPLHFQGVRMPRSSHFWLTTLTRAGGLHAGNVLQ
jgi:hypothetical protein